jgi:hypothetical protein
MHPFSLHPRIWSPFTAKVTSRDAALFFLPWNIYGQGEVATLGCVHLKKASTSEVDVNLFVVSIILRNVLSSTAVMPVNKYSADKTKSQVSLHSRTNIFPRFSPKSHYLQNHK